MRRRIDSREAVPAAAGRHDVPGRSGPLGHLSGDPLRGAGRDHGQALVPLVEEAAHPPDHPAGGLPVAGEALGVAGVELGHLAVAAPDVEEELPVAEPQAAPVVEARRRHLADVVDQDAAVEDDVEVVDPHGEREVEVLAAGDRVPLATTRPARGSTRSASRRRPRSAVTRTAAGPGPSSPGSERTVLRLRAEVTAGTTMPPFGCRRAVSSSCPGPARRHRRCRCCRTRCSRPWPSRGPGSCPSANPRFSGFAITRSAALHA